MRAVENGADAIQCDADARSRAFGDLRPRGGQQGFDIAPINVCTHRFVGSPGYSTLTSKLSEWLLNSGAYMHWMLAKPVWYFPLSCTRTEYSKTYVPFGR